MKISRQSWHYRLYRYIHSVPEGPQHMNPFAKVSRHDPALPTSLCPYAWSIFLGLLGTAVAAAIVIPVGLIVVPLLFVYHQANRLDTRVWRFRRKPKKQREETPKKERQPSLVAAYLKARKEKACPIIELVD